MNWHWGWQHHGKMSRSKYGMIHVTWSIAAVRNVNENSGSTYEIRPPKLKLHSRNCYKNVSLSHTRVSKQSRRIRCISRKLKIFWRTIKGIGWLGTVICVECYRFSNFFSDFLPWIIFSMTVHIFWWTIWKSCINGDHHHHQPPATPPDENNRMNKDLSPLIIVPFFIQSIFKILISFPKLSVANHTWVLYLENYFFSHSWLRVYQHKPIKSEIIDYSQKYLLFYLYLHPFPDHLIKASILSQEEDVCGLWKCSSWNLSRFRKLMFTCAQRVYNWNCSSKNKQIHLRSQVNGTPNTEEYMNETLNIAELHFSEQLNDIISSIDQFNRIEHIFRRNIYLSRSERNFAMVKLKFFSFFALTIYFLTISRQTVLAEVKGMYR